MEEKRIWGIHTMDDHLFLNNNVIAIGWYFGENQVGNGVKLKFLPDF